MSDHDDFTMRVLSFITNEELDNAVDSIALYLHPGAYTGSHFERLVSADPYSIDARDLLAVSMLGVQVPASAAIRILGPEAPTISRLLRSIPPDVSIDEPGADLLLAEGGPAWRIWDVLRALHGLGRTITSKLLAAKRPALIPIHDTHVARALDLEKINAWEYWRVFMQKPEARQGIAAVRQGAKSPGVDGLTDLRLLDIVIWMRMHGASALTGLESRPDDRAAPVRYETGFPVGHPGR